MTISLLVVLTVNPLFSDTTQRDPSLRKRDWFREDTLSSPDPFPSETRMTLQNLVQILGKVQRPGNYPGNIPLSVLIAEAIDRAPGSNFKVHFFDGEMRQSTLLRYEDIVTGKKNPIVPPGSIIYFPASTSALFGEIMEKQMNLFYLLVITLSALGLTAIAKQ